MSMKLLVHVVLVLGNVKTKKNVYLKNGSVMDPNNGEIVDFMLIVKMVRTRLWKSVVIIDTMIFYTKTYLSVKILQK